MEDEKRNEKIDEKKDENKKIQEPFDPHNTPEPAQEMHPGMRTKEHEERQSSAHEDRQKPQQPERNSGKKLDDSPTEIGDEKT